MLTLDLNGVRATQMGDFARRSKTHKATAEDEERACDWRGWTLVETPGWYEAVSDARRLRMRVCRVNRLAREGGRLPNNVVMRFRRMVDEIEGKETEEE